MAVEYNFRKGIDTPVIEWLAPFPNGASYHGTSNCFDGKRFMYWVIQYGTTATGASTTQLWAYDTWTDAWGYLATVTSGNQGIDIEYDPVRNVLIIIHGASLTSWQVFNLNTTAVTIANVSCAARTLTTMTPVLPVASTVGASITVVDDLAVVGDPATPDASTPVDEGVAASGSTTTTILASAETGTFAAGMIGLYLRFTSGVNAGQRRLITAVSSRTSLTVTAFGSAPAAGDTFIVEVPEGTATGGTTTTVTMTGAGWTTNMYANSDVIIVSGTGAGQRRRIASNTADTLTLASAVSGNARTGAFTTAPASGSVFRIVPSSDFLYYKTGNNATSFYKLDLAQTTGVAWVTLATTPAGTSGGGNSFYPGTYAPFEILLVRGSGTSNLYVYDIGPNAWTTMTTYAASETFTTGASAAMLSGKRRVFVQKEGAVRTYIYDLATGILEPFVTLPWTAPGAYDGKRARFVKTEDGARFLYVLRGGGQEFYRIAVEWL